MIKKYDEELAKIIITTLQKEKTKHDDNTVYFGGHQVRLGHYLRHLFQLIKFIDENINLNEDEQSNYIEIVRAQLSTYEQGIILINCLSQLGKPWKDRNWISKYNLINNLHPEFIKNINPKKYFPLIIYDWENQNLKNRY